MKKEEVVCIEHLILIEHDQEETPQGIVQELYRSTELDEMFPCGVTVEFLNRNTVRGLHRLNAQRLITCLDGSVFLAVVDLRVDTETPENVFTITLDAARTSVLVPEYCAVGLMAISKSTVLTLLDDEWNPEKVEHIHWKSFGIKWPNRKKYHLREADSQAPKWQSQL